MLLKKLLFLFIGEHYFMFGHSFTGNLVWNRSLKEFVPIEKNITLRSEEGNFSRNYREFENHNFRGQVMKVASFELENIVNFYDNGTKITGVSGEMWNILSEYLNFTIVPIKAQDIFHKSEASNISHDILDMLLHDDVQLILRTIYFEYRSPTIRYITPVWKISFRFYIKRETKPNSSWLMHIFSRKVLYAILLSLISLSVLSYAMEKKSSIISRNNFSHSLHDYFFYTFGIFCYQGYVPENMYRRTRILAFSTRMLGLLLFTSVSSNLIVRMTNDPVEPIFTDFETMMTNTDFNVITANSSVTQKIFQARVEKFEASDRITYVESIPRVYEEGCWGKKKYAIFETEDVQRAYGRFKCDLIPVGKSYFPTWVTAAVTETFKFKKTLDIGIMKLKEYGLLSGLKNRWLAFKIIDINPESASSISFAQVSMVFLVLCMGMIVSILILIFEYIYYFHYYFQISRRG